MLLEKFWQWSKVEVMKTACKFCQKFGGTNRGGQIADRVLFESENFVVVPTVGSIVPGWLLVVPRSHFLSIGSLDEAQFREFVTLQKTAAEALRECFGSVYIFEHGAARECETVGCGVDHAHLHIVATSVDILADAKALSTAHLQWRPVSGIQTTRSYATEQMPYVFVQPPYGDAWIGSANTIESQLIRKIIAAATGQPDCWDWKSHPFEDNARETVIKLEAWKTARCAMSA
jgi:ATP adenylyltransferase